MKIRVTENSTGDRPVHYTLKGKQQEDKDDALDRAILVLRERLETDKEYRKVWIHNLEMSFMGYTTSVGARRFLDLLAAKGEI